jgi:hypothetical protein
MGHDMQSIITSALGTDNILFTQYIYDNISLTRSIIVKNNTEANLYNIYVKLNYPSKPIDTSDPTTWRYYKHLTGQYHETDQPIVITSLDTGLSITLDKPTLNKHTKTKEELSKYSKLYDSTVASYPEQELFIKSILADSTYTNITDIINAPNYTILGYNSTYVEPNEDSLIHTLNQRLNNYSNIWLIPYYSNSDTLFCASQYLVLYQYLLTTILAIRQENCKTLQAHSFHIKNYLASNFGLDVQYDYLTRKQALFLYRNILYLKNHSGFNNIYNILITNLFNDRNISVVNYNYDQLSTPDTDNYITYKFRQNPIGDKTLLYSAAEYSLVDLQNKEVQVAPSNNNYYNYNYNSIDYKLKNTLFNTLLTKDIETLLIDATDSVQYKFMQTLVDNWIYLIATNRIFFLTSVVDTVNNKQLYLNQQDLYKLYVYLLHKVNGIDLKTFPTYTITRVYKDTIPDITTLMSSNYINYSWYKQELESIVTAIPLRPTVVYSFNDLSSYVDEVYRYDIALWTYLSNLHDIDDFGQFKNMTDFMTKVDYYTPDQETVTNFLNRVSLSEITTYDNTTLNNMLHSILNTIYDNKLDFLYNSVNVQKAMVAIFEKLKSYTVQLINTYYYQSPTLCGVRDTRYSTRLTTDQFNVYTGLGIVNYEESYVPKYKHTLDVFDSITSSSYANYSISSYVANDFYVKEIQSKAYTVTLQVASPTNANEQDWIVSSFNQADTMFLATNQL